MMALKFVFGLTLGLLNISYSQACERSSTEFFCLKDMVYSRTEGSFFGEVVEISSDKIKVSTTSWKEAKILEVSKENLYLMKGCLKQFCVDDNITASASSGKIVGVNPYQQALVFIDRAGDYRTTSMDYIATSVGCSRGFCVGDGMYLSHPGKVLGVYPNHSGLYLYTRDDWWRPEVVGNLSSSFRPSSKNPKYSDEQRSKTFYPELDEARYLILDLKFSFARPTKD